MRISDLPRYSVPVLALAVLGAALAASAAPASAAVPDALDGLRGVDAELAVPTGQTRLGVLLTTVADAADADIDLQIEESVAAIPASLSADATTVRRALEQLRDEHGLWYFVDGPSSLIVLQAHRGWGLDGAPRVLRQVDPEYPDGLRQVGVKGEVWLEGLVMADGSVDYLRILKTEDDGFAGPALDAVRQWRFEPATLDGRPVNAVAVFTVTFDS